MGTHELPSVAHAIPAFGPAHRSRLLRCRSANHNAAMRLPSVVTAVALLALSTFSIQAQSPKPRPLAEADREGLASLLRIEDTRQFDEPMLTRLLQSPHPAVRRRAVQTIARVISPRGSVL